MPLVVSSAALPIDVRPLLGDGAQLRIPASGSMPRAELLAAVGEAEALISLLDVSVDDELLDRAPRLRVVANCAVGFDNVDVAACTARRIAVCNTPDVLTEATADFTFALLLAAARRLPEGEALVRSGNWRGWAPDLLLGEAVARRTLGIVGLGRIGQAVARRARGFAMEILYTGSAKPEAATPLGAEHVPLEELLGRSDYVSLHCPLRPDTRHLIDQHALARMKKSAFLINTARGGCVDEAALADALDRGVIAGCGLDVFEREPEVHPRLLASSRAVLAPHLGSATTDARGAMARLCGEAVRAVLTGERPRHLVNPEVWA